ncbi:hypothetical protein [Actinokineospora bangkokensis]|uniref:Uncharacterized protein n=1 Tax=Actinokineospora bangkokensis TaxID=1193682 RepID=A0A1Q9LRR6_9PSEU|nr:hypothetical protein [Actinokineospora bangkokensis]OLR94725.1 hypothetical protein BJP25_11000 [Actinokineospora bangkokensis]
MRGECPDCAVGLAHCHGTLLVAGTGVVECSDPECEDLDEAVHPLVLRLAAADRATARDRRAS